MVGLVQLLHGATAAPIFLLSVPWMDSPAWPNGQTDPGASAADHTEINSLLATAAESAPSVHFIDVSKYLTPSGQFEANVGGQPCRDSDGVHLDYHTYTHCGAALAGGVLSTVPASIEDRQALSWDAVDLLAVQESVSRFEMDCSTEFSAARSDLLSGCCALVCRQPRAAIVLRQRTRASGRRLNRRWGMVGTMDVLAFTEERLGHSI